MLQEFLASPGHRDGSKAICTNEVYWHTPISRCGQIENAITASRLWGRSTDFRSVRLRRGEKMGNNSTRRARHNVGAIGQVEGALKTVDLSAMDLRVLDLMRLGKTTKETAARLRIPERTVALHVRHSLRRLRARSAEELLSLIKRYH